MPKFSIEAALVVLVDDSGVQIAILVLFELSGACRITGILLGCLWAIEGGGPGFTLVLFHCERAVLVGGSEERIDLAKDFDFVDCLSSLL